MSAHENETIYKRNYLRKIFIIEEAKSLCEIDKLLQNQIKKELTENQKRNEKLLIQDAIGQQAILRLKIIQQHTNNCAESKAVFSNAINKSIRYSQQVQILENNYRRRKKIN